MQAAEVVSPGLRKLLVAVMVIFSLLVVDSVYLATVTFLQWLNDVTLENAVYQTAFLAHLALGIVIIVPSIVYAILHLRRAIDRPNRIAVRLGLALFVTLVVLLITGVALTRGMPIVEIRDPLGRESLYWLHVIAPLVLAWLFILHRLAGSRIRWGTGIGIGVASIGLSVAGVWLSETQRVERTLAPEPYFFPSLARPADGRFIDAADLMRDEYCAGCHQDIHAQWQYSAHRFASFNNPAYLFSVRNTRQMAMARDGDVRAARFCAGCHDPVPLFSGAFDDPDFDDVKHPTADAGITCVACHAIEQLNSPRGNADYLISAPEHYPFAFSDDPRLVWLNGILIKGKPSFHKKTFLKPLHKSAEFCGTCHKVHLPEELNHYRWLRGQNHYDSYLLSGVSGHGVASFYYPDQAVDSCNECHMPLTPSSDFGAKPDTLTGTMAIHGHHFPAANTAIPHLLDMPPGVNEKHRSILKNSLRVDVFAVREGVNIEAPVDDAIRPSVPMLKPGSTYLIDIVIRTLTLGHLFSEGTADSNQIWLDVAATTEGKTIGRSGALRNSDGGLDPWSHFVNAYVLDRRGTRIDRRNAEDIFTKLYDHQIPPGAADVIQYRLEIPASVTSPIELTARLQYRKFDTAYTRAFLGDAFVRNDLPVTTIAEDRVVFPNNGASQTDSPAIPEWQRWNDYGIGLLRKPDRGQLRQAEAAFRHVIKLHRPEGALNLARVLLREGRLDEAVDALQSASTQGAYPWSIDWFGGLVDLQNGNLDAAIDAFNALTQTNYPEARARGFDFSLDYRLQNTLAQTLFERSKLAASDRMEVEWLDRAANRYQQSLQIDPENVTAHYGLAQVYARLDRSTQAEKHRQLHQKYRRDDNAHDLALASARRSDPAANHASEAVVIYELQRRGAYGLPVDR